MASPGTVEHAGIINLVNDKLVRVRIMQETACGSCQARGSCSIGDNNEKIIEVIPPPGELFIVGEKISVVLERSLGIKALWLGYILPFLIMVSILVVLISTGLNEGAAGLLSLLSLVPYYFVLSLFREKLNKEYSFRLKKL